MTTSPQFFVPYIDDSAKSEKIWQGIKTLMEDRQGGRGSPSDGSSGSNTPATTGEK
jgi:hypothetical protein